MKITFIKTKIIKVNIIITLLIIRLSNIILKLIEKVKQLEKLVLLRSNELNKTSINN